MKSVIIDLIPPLFMRKYNSFLSRQSRFRDKNNSAVKNFSLEFELVHFSYLDKKMEFELKWGWWSRIYEYPLVLNQLKDLGWNRNSLVHNTCWGSQGCHILFKNQLESECDFVTNSDVMKSQEPNTTILDLRHTPPDYWLNRFDFVLNVSTLEEIRFSHIKIFENLLSMVKPGGHLIATFDLPGLDLEIFEELFQSNIKEVDERLNGENSPYKMSQFSNLEVGYLVVKRI